MVKMLVIVPQSLRDELTIIRSRDGVSLSLQARMSLQLWVNAVNKNPHGANGLIGRHINKLIKVGEWATQGSDTPVDGSLEPKPYDPGPEPDIHTEPAKWAKWSAKAGNAAIAKLAKGEWGD